MISMQMNLMICVLPAIYALDTARKSTKILFEPHLNISGKIQLIQAVWFFTSGICVRYARKSTKILFEPHLNYLRKDSMDSSVFFLPAI